MATTTYTLTGDQAEAVRQAAVVIGQVEELLSATTPLLTELRQLLERVAPDPRLHVVD